MKRILSSLAQNEIIIVVDLKRILKICNICIYIENYPRPTVRCDVYLR